MSEPEEVEPDEEVLEASVEETDPPDARPADGWGDGAGASAGEEWRADDAYDAGAIAAITPAVPRAAAVPSYPSRAEIPAAWSAMPARQAPWSGAPVRPASQSASFGHAAPAPSPGALRDSNPRTSVAPVVMASLPPVTAAPRMPVARRRLSADSKLLAAGGALAAAMLLVAVGVLLGQHSTTTSPAAATPGAYPVVVEAKAPTAAAALPPAATALPVEARPAPGPVVEKVDGPTTVDVQQLPSAPKPRPQGWSVVAAAPRSTGSAGGWMVAGSPPARSAPAAVDPAPRAAIAPTALTAPSGTDAPESIASAAAVAPEPPAPAAAPPVDPLVQAVREDIREDEARSK